MHMPQPVSASLSPIRRIWNRGFSAIFASAIRPIAIPKKGRILFIWLRRISQSALDEQPCESATLQNLDLALSILDNALRTSPCVQYGAHRNDPKPRSPQLEIYTSNNLAPTLRAQRDDAAGGKLQEQVVAARRRALAEDDRDS